MRTQIKEQSKPSPSRLYLFVLILVTMCVLATLKNAGTFMFWFTFFTSRGILSLRLASHNNQKELPLRWLPWQPHWEEKGTNVNICNNSDCS